MVFLLITAVYKIQTTIEGWQSVMALRVVSSGCRLPPPYLPATRWLRHSSTNSVRDEKAKGASHVWPSEQAAGTTDLVPGFGDTKEAYRSKSFLELLRHYVVFKSFTFNYLVDNNKAVSEVKTVATCTC